MTNRTRAVFFDLGGTLFSNRQIPLACMPELEEAARRLGVEGGVAGIGRAFRSPPGPRSGAWVAQQAGP